MNLSQDQKDQINKLIDCRDNIVDHLADIQTILKNHFPEEYDIAYQFWIPQIITALYDTQKWLPRGEKNMQQTIDRLIDKMTDAKNKGVSKYII